jgi:hypothetical protein
MRRPASQDYTSSATRTLQLGNSTTARGLTNCAGGACRFVPVIKMKVDGIPVDLLFVSLNLDSIPESVDILDDQYLRGLDESSVRSCNGVRVTERVLQLVPHPDRFRTTLIAVKHWARVRVGVGDDCVPSVCVLRGVMTRSVASTRTCWASSAASTGPSWWRASASSTRTTCRRLCSLGSSGYTRCGSGPTRSCWTQSTTR